MSQLILFDIKQDKDLLYKGIYFISDTLYKNVKIMQNDKESIPVFVIEAIDINGDYFQDRYDRIYSFKDIC